jgi:hypothetical protein
MFHRRNRIVLVTGVIAAVIAAVAAPASARPSAGAQASAGAGVTVTGSLSWSWSETPVESGYTITGADKQTGTFTIDLTGEDTSGNPTGDTSTYSVSDDDNITYTDNQTGCATKTAGNSSSSGSFPLTPASGTPWLYAAVTPTNPNVDVIIGVPFTETQTTTWSGPSGCTNETATDTVTETATPDCLTSTGGDDGDTGVLQGTYPDGTVSLSCPTDTYNSGTDTGSFSITGTLTVGGGTCGAAGSIVCVAAVRYAPVGADDDNTPGLPVVKDDGTDPVFDHEWGSDISCNGLADPQDYDWLDCSGSGSTDKDWPVIYSTGETCESGGSPAGAPMPAGESSTPVYVTFAPYVQPEREAAVLPYISILDVGTAAAAGATSQEDAFDGIWEKFASLNIAHPILDPVTGDVTYGTEFKYYDNGYSTIADWWNKPFFSCPEFYTFLSTDSGHCGNWAQFLAGVLGWQGIPATYLSLRRYGVTVPGFYPGRDPGPGDAPEDYVYMLIDPALWTFGTANAAGPYPYADTLTVKDGTVSVGSQSFTYNPGPPIAQGGVSTPPEMFATGDHAIVLTDDGYLDPSYGLPTDDTPYPSLEGTYEPAAIAGFAAVYYQEKSGAWTPVPLNLGDITADCTSNPCQFRAVPYGQSGAP